MARAAARAVCLEMLRVQLEGKFWEIDPLGHEIAIVLDPDGAQPNHFGAAPATSEPLSAGTFAGDTRIGGSCNCETLTVTPHCNGTHTECVGHVTDRRFGVDRIASGLVGVAALVSVTPEPARDSNDEVGPHGDQQDLLISKKILETAVQDIWQTGLTSLVLRSLPNVPGKRSAIYPPDQPCPYLSAGAAELLVELGVHHLLVDLPSIDRLLDGGELLAHRIFWGLPPGSRDLGRASRKEATITEMVFVPDAVPDGRYFLNLQLPRIASDAVPSRPVLHPLRAMTKS
jgi:arylformamidase